MIERFRREASANMRRLTARPQNQNRAGAASLDFILILGVVLPIVALILPLSRTAIQASFAWFSRVITCPFM